MGRSNEWPEKIECLKLMAQRSQPSPAQPRSTADKTAALKLTPVSRETELRLDRYVDLLLEWQAKTNLIASSTLPHLWTRHISDSLQLLTLAPSANVWVDLEIGRASCRERVSCCV